LRRRLFNVFLALAVVLAALGRGPAPAGAAEAKRLLVLGDSLTAGYGLAPEAAFPAQLERHLKGRGLAVRVLNGGVSGDTTAGGRARLGWALAEEPGFAIVALGGNDGLRGIDPAATRANLDDILRQLKARGVKVLLAGMRAPPNLGRRYGEAFDPVFAELARAHDVALYPFFLDGVAADPALNQADGIHPNARGVATMVERIAPAVERLLAGP
jgi:acyl-CoA thioesterase-1